MSQWGGEADRDSSDIHQNSKGGPTKKCRQCRRPPMYVTGLKLDGTRVDGTRPGVRGFT